MRIGSPDAARAFPAGIDTRAKARQSIAATSREAENKAFIATPPFL
jgi:hypothetical protein